MNGVKQARPQDNVGNGWGWVVAQLWGLVLNVMVNKNMM